MDEKNYQFQSLIRESEPVEGERDLYRNKKKQMMIKLQKPVKKPLVDLDRPRRARAIVNKEAMIKTFGK